MSAELSVVALGARTAVGATAPSTAAAIRAGITRLEDHPFMVDAQGDPIVAACDRLLPPDLPRADRLIELASTTLEQVLLRGGRPIAPESTIPVFLALPEPSEHMSEHALRRICTEVSGRLRGLQPISIVPLAHGHAAGGRAFEQALTQLPTTRESVGVVAGVDSHLDADILDALEAEQRLHTPSTRYGFPPGEAAAAALLAPRGLAASLGQRFADVMGASSAQEPQSQMLEDPVCTGQGLATAWRGALARLPAQGPRVGMTYVDANGERYRDREITYTLLRAPISAFDELEDLRTVVDACGDVGASTTLLHTIVAILGRGRCGTLSSTHALLSASSFSGLRSAVLLHLHKTR